MSEPQWSRLLEMLMPGVTALVAFLMGKATKGAANQQVDRKSTRLNSSHPSISRMPSSA